MVTETDECVFGSFDMLIYKILCEVVYKIKTALISIATIQHLKYVLLLRISVLVPLFR